MGSGCCDAQAADANCLNQTYCEDILRKHESLFLQLFLHLADVSNPLKPFEHGRTWAYRVLDEFFEQGDEEKQLGIPVGMLNDREKICRPASQFGFIVFLVCPLALGSVRIFAPLLPLAQNMADNLQRWRDVWVAEVNPNPEEVSKKDAEISNKQEEVYELEDRERPPDSSPMGSRLVGPSHFKPSVRVLVENNRVQGARLGSMLEPPTGYQLKPQGSRAVLSSQE